MEKRSKSLKQKKFLKHVHLNFKKLIKIVMRDVEMNVIIIFKMMELLAIGFVMIIKINLMDALKHLR
jgi:hypothetical protein